MRPLRCNRLCYLALAAIAVRLVVVAAFAPLMPALAAAQAGGATTVICAEHGLMQIAASPDAPAERTGSDEDPRSDAPRFCPFCLSLPVALAAGSANVVPVAPTLETWCHSRLNEEAVPDFGAAVGWQARAPPQFPLSEFVIRS